MFRTRQLAEPTALTASNSAITTGTYTFLLSNLDQATSFTDLFDEYKIEAIRFTIYPTSNAVQIPTTSTTTFTQLYSIIDYNGGSTPNTAALCREKASCMILQPGESCSRTFRPQVAVNAGDALPLQDQWYPTSSPSVAYHGMTIFIPQVTAAQTLLQTWNLEIDYHVAFRNVV